MGIEDIQRKLDIIFGETAPQLSQGTSNIHGLFECFKKLETELSNCSNDSENIEIETKADGLCNAQTIIMRAAAYFPAKTQRDLLYKLAMWRLDNSELDSPIHEMKRGDAIAYSTFRDLVAMTGDTSVLSDNDHEIFSIAV